jgi:chromosomal replication initiation ATPase DnaA
MGEGKPAQLPLELPLAPRLGRSDFLAAPSTEAALAMVERWPDWHDRILLLIGPPGSGKSHLLAIFAERASALRAKGDRPPSLEALNADMPDAIAIDDIDCLPDETALFHLLNFAVEHRVFVLMTAKKQPTADEVRLPDLLSRLRRAPVVEIGAPDDDLMLAVLDKLFRDRQLRVEPPALAYAALRLERSLDAARAFVAALDREALIRQRPVTRAMAAQVMERFEARGSATDD